MNKNITGIILAAIAIGVLVYDKQPTASQEKGIKSEPTKFLKLEDGGSGYFQIRRTDAGTIAVKTTPDCVRRPLGKPLCNKRASDGGIIDPGDMNRFSASQAVGPDCQPVACSVYFGQDSLQEEK